MFEVPIWHFKHHSARSPNGGGSTARQNNAGLVQSVAIAAHTTPATR